MQQPTLLELPEDILCRVCELCASSQPGAVAAQDVFWELEEGRLLH